MPDPATCCHAQGYSRSFQNTARHVFLLFQAESRAVRASRRLKRFRFPVLFETRYYAQLARYPIAPAMVSSRYAILLEQYYLPRATPGHVLNRLYDAAEPV